MLAIGALALALLALPFALRAWADHRALAGKVQLFQDHSYRPDAELALCLLKRAPGGLALAVVSEDHYADPARGLALTIDNRGDFRVVRVYGKTPRALDPAALAQVRGCLGRPDRGR